MRDAAQSAARGWWRLHPLARFALLGALIFAADRWRERASTRPPEIVLSRDFVEGMRAGLARERGRAPTEAELDARLAEHVRAEALHRVALARGLDRGDGIIRRRLAQKLAYLLEAEADPGPPTEAQLRAHFDAHPERYRDAPRMDLSHRFFSADLRGARAADDARAALASGHPGDPFLRGTDLPDRTRDEVAGLLGEDVARALDAAPTNTWIGPVASPYGQHLLRVRARREGARDLAASRDAVARDWRDEARARRVEEAVRALVQGFRVVRE